MNWLHCPAKRSCVRSCWKPRELVMSLKHYAELSSDVTAGSVVPGESTGSPAPREPGTRMERLLCRKADIDLALDRLPAEQSQAVCLYYIKGYGSVRSVGHAMGCSHMQAWRLLRAGVGRMAKHLCGYPEAAEEAVAAIGQGRRHEK